eukprot:3383998-Prymnesium_polylepis.3
MPAMPLASASIPASEGIARASVERVRSGSWSSDGRSLPQCRWDVHQRWQHQRHVVMHNSLWHLR